MKIGHRQKEAVGERFRQAMGRTLRSVVGSCRTTSLLENRMGKGKPTLGCRLYFRFAIPPAAESRTSIALGPSGLNTSSFGSSILGCVGETNEASGAIPRELAMRLWSFYTEIVSMVFPNISTVTSSSGVLTLRCPSLTPKTSLREKYRLDSLVCFHRQPITSENAQIRFSNIEDSVPRIESLI